MHHDSPPPRRQGLSEFFFPGRIRKLLQLQLGPPPPIECYITCPTNPPFAMNPLINNADNNNNKDFILHCTKQVDRKNSEQTKEWRERHTQRQRQRCTSWVVVFFFSKKQTLAKTTYLLLCYAHTQFLDPGRRDLQEPLPTNSKLSETIWARAILYESFVFCIAFIHYHSWQMIWSSTKQHHHHHSTIISHNNNAVPAACLQQHSGRWPGFVEWMLKNSETRNPNNLCN